MEEAIDNKLRKQQHLYHRLGDQVGAETAAAQPLLEQAQGTL